MNPNLIRNPNDQALYDQAAKRFDYKYNNSDAVSAQTAYREYNRKAKRNVMAAHALGGVVAVLTKQRVRNFFATSVASFIALNYFNDSECRKIVEKSAQNNIERLNVMMDLD